MSTVLEEGLLAGELRSLDVHFARWLHARWGGRNCDELELAAALLSRQSGEGHVCLELRDWAEKAAFRDRAGKPFGMTPGIDAWSGSLRRSAAVGEPGDWAPLILDGERLYLGRLWFHEARLAENLINRARAWAGGVDREKLRCGLEKLFPESGEARDWQKVAACLAVLKQLLVISGGPGTGKTRTVTSILALILEQAPDLRIGLAAPTGKAAARLRESVLRARSELRLESELAALLPTEASTIHRLLGSRPGRASFRHDAANTLPLDVLVVDEASMVDLPLMAKLVDALRPDARLILLGDKDQLASVEAGSVLADICRGSGVGFGKATCDLIHALAGERIEPAVPGSALSDNVVLLRHSYRFQADSGIAVLADAANAGDQETVIQVLRDSGRKDVHWHRPGPGNLSTDLADHALPLARRHLACNDPSRAMHLFQEFRVLCVLREGDRGVSGINADIERRLSRSGAIAGHSALYSGKPIMIARNLPALGLFNGDVGLLWSDGEAGDALRACFPDPEGGVHRVHPGRLPAYETAFAMTVHKSQGSEFDHVLIVLPEQESRVLSRELLYTAVSRARERVEIWGSEALIRSAVSRRVARGSGLADRLLAH